MPHYTTNFGKVYTNKGTSYLELKDKLLTLIKQHPGINTASLYSFLTVFYEGHDCPTPDTIIRHCKKLEEMNLILMLKSASGEWQYYHKSFCE